MRTSFHVAHRKAARWTFISGMLFLVSSCALTTRVLDSGAAAAAADNLKAAAVPVATAFGAPEIGAIVAALAGLFSAVHGARMHRKAHRRGARSSGNGES